MLLWKQNCWIAFINAISEVSEKLKLVSEVAQPIDSRVSIQTYASGIHTKWLLDPAVGCLGYEMVALSMAGQGRHDWRQATPLTHARTDPVSTLGIPTAHVGADWKPLTVVKELYR